MFGLISKKEYDRTLRISVNIINKLEKEINSLRGKLYGMWRQKEKLKRIIESKNDGIKALQAEISQLKKCIGGLHSE